MKIEKLKILDYDITVYDPEAGTCPVLYSGFEKEEIGYLYSKIKKPFAAVIWDGIDWDNDMTPWKAEKVFKNGNDFGGEADKFIDKLVNIIVPQAEGGLSFKASERIIAGYSLAGLFAMYASYKTGIFSSAASMSGSMWYDGWIDYMEQHSCGLKKAYFSVGNKEKNTRNERMARVEDCTRKACDILSGQGVQTMFELNQGNHFVDVPERIYKGINWIL